MDEAFSSAYLPEERRHRGARDQTEVPEGAGLVMFAGAMLAVAGIVNVVFGVAAASDSSYFDQNARYLIGALEGWGWVALLVGLTQVSAAIGVWNTWSWARWMGVATASLNSIVQLMWLPSQPLAALALYAVDLVVIYVLLAYGKPVCQPDDSE